MWAVCFVVGAVLPWMLWMLLRKKRLPVTVTVDDDDPKPSDVARYFAEIAARLDEYPERMRVVFVAPQGMALDMEPDGRLAIRLQGRRTCRFDLRRRWIADHSVPFALGPHSPAFPWRWLRRRRPAVLYIDPVDANRFRVSDRMRMSVPFALHVLLSLGAVMAVIMVSPLLISAVAGMVLGCVAMSLADRRGHERGDIS